MSTLPAIESLAFHNKKGYAGARGDAEHPKAMPRYVWKVSFAASSVVIWRGTYFPSVKVAELSLSKSNSVLL
jgi:hypothetical protein